MSRPIEFISHTAEWSMDLLNAYDHEIKLLAQKYQLDTYPNQIEIISAEQMMDAYSMVGMPLGYSHWSYGKQFLDIEKKYRRGQMGLAYELVINSNPCITYLLEENTLVMQAIVIAHACYGHNAFFKNNYLFKTWTNPDAIIDYLVFAKKYISDCEERYGIERVEETLDACHALANNGIDRYKHPNRLSLQDEIIQQRQRETLLQHTVNELWHTMPQQTDKQPANHFPAAKEDNFLYFIEKHAPVLEPWQREIVRIVRKIAQYFYPQRLTKMMNEGWACFWHYLFINELFSQKKLDNRFMLEFIHTHTNVIYQPPFDHQKFRGINPYRLGYSIFTDIKRICENPTNEDRLWFADFAGKPWLSVINNAMQDFKDDSFVLQFLSPKVIRDLKLFHILDDDQINELKVISIHNEDGYQDIKKILSDQYDIANLMPLIQISHVDVKGDRTITLEYQQQDNRPLDPIANRVLQAFYHLWGFPVKIETLKSDGSKEITHQYPEPSILNRPPSSQS